MRKTTQTRLDHLFEARRAQDQQIVKQAVDDFLSTLTSDELFEFRKKPDTSRQKLTQFLATMPPTKILAINRYYSRSR